MAIDEFCMKKIAILKNNIFESPSLKNEAISLNIAESIAYELMEAHEMSITSKKIDSLAIDKGYTIKIGISEISSSEVARLEGG